LGVGVGRVCVGGGGRADIGRAHHSHGLVRAALPTASAVPMGLGLAWL
jgi:hypothetical protein